MLLPVAPFLASLSLVGCSGPVAPEPIVPLVTLGTPGECARINFTISGSTVTATYPPRPNCGGMELVLVKFGTLGWNSGPRTLTLPVSVLNLSGLPVQLPIRVELPSSGRTVLEPPGTGNNKIQPLNHDSLLTGERWLWLVGGTGTLAPGDSTAPRNLTFNVQSPVWKGRLWFVGAGEEIPNVPLLPPDTMPAWVGHDSSYTRGGLGYLRGVISLRFKPSATQQDRQAAVDQVDGEVIGGFRSPFGEGPYYIRIKGNPTEAQVDSLKSVLQSLPQVQRASRPGRGVRAARLPNDTVGWRRADWALDPDSSSGANWAAEELALPLAWGCSIGSPTTKVAVLDHPFDATEVTFNVATPPQSYGGHQSDERRHGTAVAGILASPGDNGRSLAGVMWRAALYLKDFAKDTVLFDEQALEVGRAASLGFTIVNLSYGRPQAAPPAASDSAEVIEWMNDFIAEFKSIPIAQRPLLVVPAGNDRADAWLSVLPALRDTFPDNVLVVGGTELIAGPGHRDRWGQANFTVERDEGSNHGRLIDVYAPAYNLRVPKLVAGSEELVLDGGTSYSAPFVAGIAGLLLASDPTLTPTALRTLILNGALNGQRSIPNHAGRYVANAYESLKLLSKQPGMPICGNEVGFDDQGRLVVFRAPGVEEVIAPAGDVGSGISGAQGGRLIAGTSGSFDAPFVRYFALQNGTWQPRGVTGTGVHAVQFLERDTAVVTVAAPVNQRGPLRLTILGPSGTSVTNLDLGGRIGAGITVHHVLSVSPDAQMAAFLTFQPGGLYYYVDSLGASNPVQVRASPYQVNCSDPPGCTDVPQGPSGLAWAPDGRWAALIDLTYDVACTPPAGCVYSSRSRAVRFDVAQRTTQTAVFERGWIFDMVVSSNGATWRECRQPDDPLQALYSAIRSTATLATLSSGGNCAEPGAVIPNAPIALGPSAASTGFVMRPVPSYGRGARFN